MDTDCRTMQVRCIATQVGRADNSTFPKKLMGPGVKKSS